MDTLKNQIIEYMDNAQCSKKLSGYNIILHVISTAVEHPEYNCRLLFASYVKSTGNKLSMYEEAFERERLNAYRDARYCLSKSGSNKSMLDFIRNGVMQLSTSES